MAKDLVKLIDGRMRDGWDCASARNIGEWYFGEFPRRYNKENNKREYLFLAAAAWFASDYVKAAEMYRYLQDTYPDCNETDKGYMRERLEKFSVMEANAPRIDCDDERLRAVLHRLRYVFSAINRPIRAHVAPSEAEYNAFFVRQFPGHPIYPYGKFVAVGFYYDPDALWLVFKRDVIDDMDDEELTGLCAHEMAHLDLCCKGIPAQIRDFPELRAEKTVKNMPIDERLTDLYVMSKGLAYSLYRARLSQGASKMVLTAANIAEYIQKLE